MEKDKQVQPIKATSPVLLNWLQRPAETLDLITCTTMEEAMLSSSSSMALINIKDNDAAVRILTILIGEAVLYFNVGKNMGPPQIKIVIDMLLSDTITKNLKPEDYKVLFEDM